MHLDTKQQQIVPGLLWFVLTNMKSIFEERSDTLGEKWFFCKVLKTCP